MGSEWRVLALGDLGSFKNGANYSKHDYGETYPVASVKNLFRGRFVNTDGLDAIRDGVIRRVSDYLLTRGDILFARSSVKRSGAGQVAMVNEIPENCVFSGFTIRFRPHDENTVLPLFLLYLLRSPRYREEFTRIATGTTIHNLSQAALADICVPLPGIECQKRIAHILGTLDDKIELNRRMNETLEAMARALFKSWFVDFDPVIDKALSVGNPIPEPLQKRAEARKTLGAQRKPMPVSMAQHFPDRFVFNEKLGWIPEGWEAQSLDEIARYQNGLALQKFRPEDENDFLPVVKIAQLRQGYADGKEKASPKIKPECIIDDGDVVFSWSGTLMLDIWCGGKAALNQHLFKVTSDQVPKAFYYQYTQHYLAEFQRVAAGKAVTMGHIKREHLKQALCVVPSEDLLEAYSGLTDPWLRKQALCRVENRQLACVRDTLLPKLLSGQLRLSAASLEELATQAGIPDALSNRQAGEKLMEEAL